VLNLGPQPVGVRSKWIAQFDHIELAKRLAQAACTPQRLSTIEAAFGVTHDRKGLSPRRIARSHGNR
jgi:hypothetical protein